jgi:hypothetical protein
MSRLPNGAGRSMVQYAIGINDSRSLLMVKAEILKYLMHFRELTPEEIIHKSLAYLKTVNRADREITLL